MWSLGMQGLATDKNQPKIFIELADSVGVHRPKWQHSFPKRFKAAFANELNVYAYKLLLGTPWIVIVIEGDCVAVHRVFDAALELCEVGEVTCQRWRLMMMWWESNKLCFSVDRGGSWWCKYYHCLLLGVCPVWHSHLINMPIAIIGRIKMGVHKYYLYTMNEQQ